MRVTSKRLLACVLVSILLISGGTGVVLAAGQGTDSGVTKIGSQDITISDATITISDTHLDGPGFPNLSFDHQTYTLHDSTMTLDGLHVTLNGSTYEICHVELTMENIGVTLDNVQISDSS